MDLWAARMGIDRFKARSILVAGGTPTELAPEQFRRFHEGLAARIDTTNCVQISYDVHPLDLLGDDGMERLRIMRDFGSDRLTLGLQSLDDGLLKHMNRGHTAAQAYEAIDKCREAGFTDLCIEFIFGYPDQSMDMWLKTIRDAIATDVEEIQLYRLKISPYGDSPGPIERLYRKNPERFASGEEAIRMKRAAHILLNEAGYHENLTRVFTKKPEHTSHYATDQCCKLLDCIGFGLSAFSSLRDRFCINTASMHEYFEMVGTGQLPLNRGIVRSPEEQKRWSALLPLKNSWIPKSLYEDRTKGARVEDVFGASLDAMKQHGLIYEDDEIVRLTPEGRFFADEICAQLHHPRHLPFPLDDYADGPLKLATPIEGEDELLEQVPVLRTQQGLLSPA
jgi:oxygen-independent coproporphyrinogen-3 oxidase